MGFSLKTPRGSLPVFSVADEKEAKTLLVRACETNLKGEFVAKELAREQTLENLDAFSARLERAHTVMREQGLCRCREDG